MSGLPKLGRSDNWSDKTDQRIREMRTQRGANENNIRSVAFSGKIDTHLELFRQDGWIVKERRKNDKEVVLSKTYLSAGNVAKSTLYTVTAPI